MSPRREHAYNMVDVDPASFGGQLRRLREDAGLSQEELAERLGMKQQRISTFERNAVMPREDLIIKLADALDIPPARLFEASRFQGVLPLGPERRARLLELRERDWQLFDHTLDAIGDLTPEERARFERMFSAFLETWHDS